MDSEPIPETLRLGTHTECNIFTGTIIMRHFCEEHVEPSQQYKPDLMLNDSIKVIHIHLRARVAFSSRYHSVVFNENLH